MFYPIKSWICFLWLFMPIFGFSQSNRNSIWYFGDNAGLDFNSGSPLPLFNGALNTFEGCASLCDNKGDLIMYTDGITVWNKNHIAMVDGTDLNGSNSSTQSAVIVPFPGDSVQYYIFTVGDRNTNIGMQYAIADLSLESGLGAISAKNQQLITPSAEKIVAISHHNKKDFWIIAHGWNNNSFYAYLLTKDGVMPPVISNVGTIHSGGNGNNNAVGYMKCSRDGTRLALAIWGDLGLFELFKIDDETGIISNPITLPNYPHAYGIEFSPDCSKLYGSIENTASIYQFDISSWNQPDITSSALLIASGVSSQLGALQLGPDHKIYASRGGTPYLGVIQQPNMRGNKSKYVNDGVSLGGRFAEGGLPNLVPSFIQDPVPFTFTIGNDTTLCINDTMVLKTSLVDASFLWSTGSTDSSITIITSGEYWVEVSKNGFTKYDTINIKYKPCLGNDITTCLGESTYLNAGYTNGNYLWSNDSHASSITTDRPGEYWVQFKQNGYITYDTINIGFTPCLGRDTTICNNQTLLLKTGTNIGSFLWSTGSADPNILIDTHGKYWVKVTLNGITKSDTINVDFQDCVSFSLGEDIDFCLIEEPLILNTNVANAEYLWSTGNTLPYIFITNTGEYWLKITKEGSTAVDTIRVTINRQCAPAPSLIPNVFTPNNDNFNEIFFIEGLYGTWKFSVYNRWGRLIYNTEKYDNNWDGDNQPEGIYFFTLKSFAQEYKGWLQLIR